MYRKIDIISFGGHSSPLLDCDRFSCDKNNCIFIVVCCIRLYTDETSFVYSLLISADGGALHTKFRINKTTSSEERSDRSTHPSPIFVSREWCARARGYRCVELRARTLRSAHRVYKYEWGSPRTAYPYTQTVPLVAYPSPLIHIHRSLQIQNYKIIQTKTLTHTGPSSSSPSTQQHTCDRRNRMNEKKKKNP